MTRLATNATIAAVALLATNPAQAQLSRTHSVGGFGVSAGTQPSPGSYAANFYYCYSTDTIKDRDGDTIRPFRGLRSPSALPTPAAT